MILVTGASGLVGSRVCRDLLKGGYEFRAMVRESSNLKLLEGIPGDYLQYADLSNPVELEEVVRKVDMVIHCGAIISFDPSMKERMNRINVDGTRYLVDLSLKYGIKKFIHLSSVAAIGLNKGDKVVDETARWPGTVKPSRYGESKYKSELEVWRGSMEGLNTIILNSSTVMGPGDPERGSARLFAYVWKEKPYYTTGMLNYIDVRDLASVILYFVDSATVNEQYIVSGGNVPYKRFFELIAAEFGKRAPYIKTRAWMTTVAIVLEKFKSLFTRRHPLVTRETARRGNSPVIYDNSRIIRETGMRFIPIEDSVHWTCEQMKDEF